MKNCFKFLTVSLTVSGDYYQVMFHDGLGTEDEPYFMIQRQFEFTDDDSCYFESHNKELIEHSNVKKAFLSPGELRLSYGKKLRQDIEIKFGLNDGTNFQDLASTLKEMIPTIQVATH